MDYGALSSYFDGAVSKTLADVDIDAGRSNQHEFNGTLPLRSLFGDDDIRDIRTTFASCDEAEPEMCDGTVTWYDARPQTSHENRVPSLLQGTTPPSGRHPLATSWWSPTPMTSGCSSSSLKKARPSSRS